MDSTTILGCRERVISMPSGSTQRMPLSWEKDHRVTLWSWDECCEAIRGLRGRMGFPDEESLRLLSLRVSLKDGFIQDELTGEPFTVDSQRRRIIPPAIMYVLSAYAEAEPRWPTGELISARQIRGGRFYSGSNTTTKARLEAIFGQDPASERLVEAAQLLGGKESPLGNWGHSVSINPLPLVPCIIAVTIEDDEFPAEAAVYFDRSLEAFFDMEQVNFLTILTVERLVDAYRSLV
jgi:hypothetical protein